MPVALQIVVVFFCIVLLTFVVRLVAQDKLLLKYSLLWLLLVFLLIALSLFPNALFEASHFFGFEMASNFIFFAGLFCLLAIALSLSVIVSKQALKIKNLTQRLALIEYEQQENLKEVMGRKK